MINPCIRADPLIFEVSAGVEKVPFLSCHINQLSFRSLLAGHIFDEIITYGGLALSRYGQNDQKQQKNPCHKKLFHSLSHTAPPCKNLRV